MNLQTKKEKLEKELIEVNKQLEQKKNKVTTKIVKLSMGTYEVETTIHHLGKTYAECEKDCPKGWEIITYPILQELRNTQPELFNLTDTWELVQNQDKISKKKGYVARFGAVSDRTALNCIWYPAGSDSLLGVRFVRKLKENSK